MENLSISFLNSSTRSKLTIDLREIEKINNYISSGIGLLLNGLLLYLIIFKTSTTLDVYKRIFLQNCLLDIFYNVINGFIHCQAEFKAGNFYVILNGPLNNLPMPWGGYCIGLWVFSLFFCVTGLPIQFLFRYFLLIKEHLFTKREYFSLLFFSCLSALICPICWVHISWVSSEDIYKKTMLLNQDPYYYSGVTVFLSAEVWNLNLQCVFCYCYALVSLSYIIIIFTSIKVYKYLHNLKRLSSETMDIQKQITKILIVQATAPIVVCLLPIILLVTGCFLYVDISGVGIIINFLLSWIPLVNSIITILAIRTYRMFCLQWIKRIKHIIH